MSAIKCLQNILELAAAIPLKDFTVLDGARYRHGAVLRAICPDGNNRNILVSTNDLRFLHGIDGPEVEQAVVEIVALLFNSLDSLKQIGAPVLLHTASPDDFDIKSISPGTILYVEPDTIRMVLHCPQCRTQHIDQPDPETCWDNPPHKSHLCSACGCIWRPADVCTEGVLAIETRGKHDTFLLAKPVGPCIKCQMYGSGHMGECEVPK